MKTALIIAAGVVAATAATAIPASAERWHKDRFPYAERHHAMCQDKAQRLWRFERRATSDGHLSHREREMMRALQRDLDASCGRFRWRG